MKLIWWLMVVLTFASLLTGCANHNLQAPCPNFGATCHKIPVNSWDNH